MGRAVAHPGNSALSLLGEKIATCSCQLQVSHAKGRGGPAVWPSGAQRQTTRWLICYDFRNSSAPSWDEIGMVSLPEKDPRRGSGWGHSCQTKACPVHGLFPKCNSFLGNGPWRQPMFSVETVSSSSVPGPRIYSLQVMIKQLRLYSYYKPFPTIRS